MTILARDHNETSTTNSINEMSTTYQSTESGTFTPRTYESDADARSPLEYDHEHVNALLAGRDGYSTPSVRRTAIQAGRIPDPEDGSLCFECEMRHRVEARIAEHEEVLSGMERKLEVMGMNEEGREGRENKTREMIEDSVGRAMAAFSVFTGKGEKGQREKMQAPIRLKDAVGRKFIFPFHMANTWMVCPPPSYLTPPCYYLHHIYLKTCTDKHPGRRRTHQASLPARRRTRSARPARPLRSCLRYRGNYLAAGMGGSCGAWVGGYDAHVAIVCG